MTRKSFSATSANGSTRRNGPSARRGYSIRSKTVGRARGRRGRECVRDLLNYTDRTRCTREITAARLHCYSFLFFSLSYLGARSLFGELHTYLPPASSSLPPTRDEMSVYRDMIDKRIVLLRDFTLRFLETAGGSDVNYRPAAELTRPRIEISWRFNLHVARCVRANLPSCVISR